MSKFTLKCSRIEHLLLYIATTQTPYFHAVQDARTPYIHCRANPQRGDLVLIHLRKQSRLSVGFYREHLSCGEAIIQSYGQKISARVYNTSFDVLRNFPFEFYYSDEELAFYERVERAANKCWNYRHNFYKIEFTEAATTALFAPRFWDGDTPLIEVPLPHSKKTLSRDIIKAIEQCELLH